MQVLVTKRIPEVGIRLLKEASISIIQWTDKHEFSEEELIETCSHCDALLSVGVKIDARFLQACSHLKVISLFAVGYDSIDVAEATRLKIPVGNTPDVLSAATADIAFLLMLSVSRKAFYNYEKIRRGEWGWNDPTADLGIELYGKTLGIFGLGKIGMEMARRSAGAYKMNIIYCNRNRSLIAENELGATLVSFEELLQQSDVLSVHTALTPETKGIFDNDAFNKMKRSSIFINTARGGIHNEEDLTNALEKGIIWGAGLDVTNPEPMNASNKLLSMPNVAVLPHIGSATEEARNGMATIAAENIIAGLAGKKLPHVVNPEVYE